MIIDWHILGDSNPNTYLEDAIAFFAEMAAKYSSYDNVLFEICNERDLQRAKRGILEHGEAIC